MISILLRREKAQGQEMMKKWIALPDSGRVDTWPKREPGLYPHDTQAAIEKLRKAGVPEDSPAVTEAVKRHEAAVARQRKYDNSWVALKEKCRLAKSTWAGKYRPLILAAFRDGTTLNFKPTTTRRPRNPLLSLSPVEEFPDWGRDEIRDAVNSIDHRLEAIHSGDGFWVIVAKEVDDKVEKWIVGAQFSGPACGFLVASSHKTEAEAQASASALPRQRGQVSPWAVSPVHARRRPKFAELFSEKEGAA